MNELIIPLEKDGNVADKNEEVIKSNYTLIKDFAYIHNSIYKDIMQKIHNIGYYRFMQLSVGNKIALLTEWPRCSHCLKEGIYPVLEAFGHTFCSERCIQDYQLSDEDYIFFAKSFQDGNPILFAKLMRMYKNPRKNVWLI